MTLFTGIMLTAFSLNMAYISAAFAEHNHNHQHHHDHAPHHQAHSTHKAHEHGVAQMQLVMAEDKLLIQIESPLFNMLGFEHQAHNKEQHQLVEQQLQRIQQAQLFKLNSQAQCVLESKQVNHPFADSHDSHQHHDHAHHESKHRDIDFEYHFHCKQPGKLQQVDTKPLFQAWPNLHNLRVEWINHHHQSAATLNRSSTILRFE